MPTITDANGHSRSYTTLQVNGTHLILDGWLAIDGPLSAYTVEGDPSIKLPSLTPMEFMLAFTPQEQAAIEASTDPLVKVFWSRYQTALQSGTKIDPNLVSVTAALSYLAGETVGGQTIASPILGSISRIAEIRSGTAQ